MTAQLDALKGKVQRILTEEFGRIEIDNVGDFTLRHESARAFVRCQDWAETGMTIVSLTAPFLFQVPTSPALDHHVATQGGNYFFGHVVVAEDDGGATATLIFKHNLLGDYLDHAELKEALLALIFTANDLDDELQATFGGVRFHEDG